MRRGLTGIVLGGILIAGLAGGVLAADWPTYRGDNQRSGISAEALKAPLSPAWTFTPIDPPSHAWGDPQPKRVEGALERPRLRFDDAFHVAAAGGSVYFGSSADGMVYCLDAATGAIQWRFHTDGPVRLAPTAAKGKVYVGSDDGNVYCLDGKTGREVWRFRAAPDDRKVLGNGRLISLWPVRTSVLVEAGVAYFGAGVFPGDGLYLYAVNADDGKVIWKNDSYGAGGTGKLSPQGYLLASGARLFLPSGRSMPAAFSTATGAFLFHREFNWRAVGLFGGTECMLAEEMLFTGAEQFVATSQRTGGLVMVEGLPVGVPSKGERRLALEGETVYLLDGSQAAAYAKADWLTLRKEISQVATQSVDLIQQRNRFRNKTDAESQRQLAELNKRLGELGLQRKAAERSLAGATRWVMPCPHSESMLVTRDAVFAGGAGSVVAMSKSTGEQVWSAKVDGKARGLAAADGRLLVSTDTGGIHCFVPGRSGKGQRVAPTVSVSPYGQGKADALYTGTADALVRDSAARRGYGLILGGMGLADGDQPGRLAMELAQRTELTIYMVEPDAARVAAARQALTAGGVYGSRVTVLHGGLESLPLPDYFANLIVVAGAGRTPTPPAELLRLLKPCGGVAVVQHAPVAATNPASPLSINSWVDRLQGVLKDLGETGTKIEPKGFWTVITRGRLNGAGAWTHQYADAGNTAGSDDRLVSGPIGILWYGEPGPGRMPSRHSSNSAPLAINGRMFVQGEDVIMAYDAYNGVELWTREIPGAIRVGLKRGVSNLAADGDSLYVAVGDQCHRLDAATGRTLKTYAVPPGGGADRRWGYLAVVDGTVYGSFHKRQVDNMGREAVYSAAYADGVFAVAAETGRLAWSFDGKTIDMPTICVGGGRMFLVDRAVSDGQRDECLKGVDDKLRVDARGRRIAPDVRRVVCLDARSGGLLWSAPQYFSDCVGVSSNGGDLTAMAAGEVLLLCGQPWNGHFWKEFLAGEFTRRSLIAMSAADGRVLWSGRKGYRSRPLIVGDTIIAEPWAHDLQTGSEKMRINPVTGAQEKWQMSRPGHHCGNIAGCEGALFFRSGTTAYYDLTGDYGTAHFGAQRPGCWINCIPANGLVIMPEASSGCICPYSVHCTVVFAPRKVSRVWGVFSAAGAAKPVKRLAVNFGAPGDRKDAAGNLWLAWPRPGRGRLVMDLELAAQLAEGGHFQQGNADFLKLAGTEDPWIYAFAAEGLASVAVPVNEADGPGGKYTVRLHFAEIEDIAPGRRVFDVDLQGKTVLPKFDIAAEAGGAAAVVKEFKGVQITGDLKLEVKARKGLSRLCALEIVAE